VVHTNGVVSQLLFFYTQPPLASSCSCHHTKFVTTLSWLHRCCLCFCVQGDTFLARGGMRSVEFKVRQFHSRKPCSRVVSTAVPCLSAGQAASYVASSQGGSVQIVLNWPGFSKSTHVVLGVAACSSVE
jgi:hypothetical protein